MERITILLVEDHLILRAGLNMILGSQEDFEVVGETSSGREALALAADLKPRIVLLDLSLDDMNGLHIIAELKNIDPGVKVLVLTMYDDELQLLTALEEGCDGYMLKKAGAMDLIAAIRAVNRDEIFLDPSLTKVVLKNLYGPRRGLQCADKDDKKILSSRENEVLKLVALGYTNKQIANKLVVSIKTVESHKAHIREKLNMSDRSELVKYAIQRGLLREQEEQN